MNFGQVEYYAMFGTDPVLLASFEVGRFIDGMSIELFIRNTKSERQSI